MEQDPLIFDTLEDEQVAANAVLDFLTLDAEIRRYRLIQATCFFESDLISILAVPPGGKVGQVIDIMEDQPPLLITRTRKYPDLEVSRYAGQYLDLPAGWTMRVIFSSVGGPPEGGRAIVGYERITQERIKLRYGSKAALDTTTGLVSYPEVDDPDNIILVRSV